MPCYQKEVFLIMVILFFLGKEEQHLIYIVVLRHESKEVYKVFVKVSFILNSIDVVRH